MLNLHSNYVITSIFITTVIFDNFEDFKSHAIIASLFVNYCAMIHIKLLYYCSVKYVSDLGFATGCLVKQTLSVQCECLMCRLWHFTYCANVAFHNKPLQVLSNICVLSSFTPLYEKNRRFQNTVNTLFFHPASCIILEYEVSITF